MKLSRIIELALINYYGAHWSKHQFMCNAIENMERAGQIDKKQRMAAIKDIEELLLRIYPGEYTFCLVTSLCKAGYVPTNSSEDNIAYTTQLYVWWVFDLKNKGL